MKSCNSCGATSPDTNKFCSSCGMPLEQAVCKACQAPLKEGMKFCTSCGSSIETAVVDSKKTVFQTYGKYILMGLLAIFVLVAAMSALSGNDSEKQSPVITVKAKDLVDDYIRDQASAETKYKNKRISINGTVQSKFQYKNSNNYGVRLEYRFVGGKDYMVTLDVDPKLVKDLNQLKQGDFVTAEGICVGIVKQDDPTDISIQVTVDKIN